jgi:hypothetical protein
MRELIDLSRMKSAAGRAGGNSVNFSRGKKAPPAASTPIQAPQPSPEGFDMLAGLDAFA